MMNGELVPNALSRLRSRRGAALVLLAIALVSLLAICALVVDLGVERVAAEQLQNVADAAALAGAGKLRAGLDQAAAKEEAIRIAEANTVLKDPQIVNGDTDVIVGSWDATSGRVVPWDETIGEFAVQVTARRTVGSANGPIPTFFAKVFGVDSMDVVRTAIAGLQVRKRPAGPVQFMIVQDGSSSFRDAWSKAIDADVGLLNLVNSVSIEGDAAGMVVFNAKLPDSYLRSAGLSDLYSRYPGMNQGIKHTTDTNGRPRTTTDEGVYAANGLVRPMAGALTPFNPHSQEVLPQALDKIGKLVKNGNAWGYTDTSAGLNYAIDRLAEMPGSGKVIVLVSDGRPNAVVGGYNSPFTQTAVVAADRAGAAGIRIHTVTLEGTSGANFEFNEELVRNKVAALRAANADDLAKLLVGIGTMEIGRARLLK